MIRRIALVAVVACLAIAGVAPRALSQGARTENALFLWKVTADGGGEAWLFGSIHAGTKDMYPLPDPIEKAFASSKKLVVEADIDNFDPSTLQNLILTKGRYPEGDSLSKHLNKETIAFLKDFAVKNGVPFESIDRTKPWLNGLLISSMTIQDAGMDTALGLDMHFLKAAKSAGKEVLELEGVEKQLDFIASLPDSEQEADLVASLSELGSSAEQLSTIVQAWKTGDAVKLEEMTTDSIKKHPETKPAYEVFLNKRNDLMVAKIEGYLKTKDAHFIVVGALHLVGEKGLVRQLEARKYKVEQIRGK